MTAPLNPELFTRDLLDTRRPGGDGSGCILELTRSGELRVIVIVNWPSSGLLAQYETLTPEQTRDMVNRLVRALPPAPGERGPDRLFTEAAPPAGEMHAQIDREMHAETPARGAWENPFAAEGET